jgi:hypothetical protein
MILDQFVKYGEQFSLMSIVGPYRIYRRGGRPGISPSKSSYEIIKPYPLKGELIYPGASMWGIYGWSAVNEVEVVRIIEKLQKKDSNNIEKATVKLKEKLLPA